MKNTEYFPHKSFTQLAYTPFVYSDWKPLFDKEFAEPYFISLQQFLDEEHRNQKIFPPRDEILSAFTTTSWVKTKVIIVGQDPYHGPGQANGLAFSVNTGVAIPPSLRNIFQELHTDLGISPATHGNLHYWATQGVLLLNTTLTVRDGQPKSHVGHGWETFTDRVISYLNETKVGCVFVLWGTSAQKKSALINPDIHHIVSGVHPSPLSAHRGFFGSRPFSRINHLLLDAGHTPIDWELPEP